MDEKENFTAMKAAADEKFKKRRKWKAFERFNELREFEAKKRGAIAEHRLQELLQPGVKAISEEHNRPAERLVKGKKITRNYKYGETENLIKELYVELKQKERGLGR